MGAFHEFLASSTAAVVREPTTNRPLTPRTMRRIVRRMGACGYFVHARARAPAAGIVDCLENVVDALMSEILEEDFVDAGAAAAMLEEWQLNMERAVTALASQNRAVARMKVKQCLSSCECTRECDGCAHEAARAIIATLLR